MTRTALSFTAVLSLALPACVPVAGGAGSAEAEAADEKVPEAKAGTFPDESITVGTQKRAFRLVVPTTVDLTKPAPLVIAFHGMGIDSKDVMPKYTRLDELAADKKFVLAYPGAAGRSWGLAPDKVTADLAFFDALLDHLTRRHKIDPDRVYVIGMSNGGYFAHLVGAERSKTVAAVASHSGPLGLQTLGGINAKRKFPVMIVHGDADRLLPVEWARENRDKYTKEGHEVKYVEVAGLGHLWATKQKINDQLWEFFEKHPRK
ncbi:MAG: phospholipase/Carboxylesterase [Gemmataceae bacterium]|nr:phospholipase/Carboxylesterase [Gemmataceae bacterium]